MKKKLLLLLLILRSALSPSIVGATAMKEIHKFQMIRLAQTEKRPDLTVNSHSFEEPEIGLGLSFSQDLDIVSTTIPSIEQNRTIQPPSETANNIADNSETERITTSEIEEIAIVKNQSTSDFINAIGVYARKIAWEHDLYASVMIAQAILESGAGNSSLSSMPYYNLFGIKGEFNGATVVMKTQEDDGKGNLFMIDSAFRQYPSYRESLEDYARLLKDGVFGNSDFYRGAWKSETTNYMEVTAFLTGRYATDNQYAEKLNQLIDIYELTCHDNYQDDRIKEPKKFDKSAMDNDKMEKQASKGIEIRNMHKLINNLLKERKTQKHVGQIKIVLTLLNAHFVKVLKLLKD